MTSDVSKPEAGKAQPARQRVSILLPLPLAGAYDYAIPPGMTLRPGDYVAVPLGTREVLGVVWGSATGEVDGKKLKPVIERLDAPPMPRVLRRFIDWVATYTLNPPGAVLRMAMRVPAAFDTPKPVIAYRSGGPQPERMTPARQRVLDVLETGPPRTATELAREAGVGTGVVRGLVDAGTLEPVPLPRDRPFPRPDADHEGLVLSSEQVDAADRLRGMIGAGFSVTLLDGVTGAGKTEVYFEAVAAALKAGRQVLILLPEIALTAQFLERFAARFGSPPAEWHSDLAPNQRRRTWRAVADGGAQVVVGARSALFLPFPDLGLIIVDEEHDTAFKQEDGVIYHARDMAVVRGQLGSFPVVLSSATPSIETIVNARAGRYRTVHLPERHGSARLPEIEIVDMRAAGTPRGSWIAPSLAGAIAHTLDAQEQAMLFLNRRGYAPLTLCGECGHRFTCPHCTAWLVEHRYHRELMCHHCGYSIPEPPECPKCGSTQGLRACGPGVERLAEEVVGRFPEARVAVLSSDTPGGSAMLRETIEAVEKGDVDILIGTQIVAKGHHFPKLTLVGVVDADLGFSGGDFRAFERTYQLLHQVSGRAGRADRSGRAVLQTYMPENEVIEALRSGNKKRFIEREIEGRRLAGLPPFGRLVALILSGPDLGQVQDVGAALARCAPSGEEIRVLGPAPAPLALLRGRHRLRFYIQATRRFPVQSVVGDWISKVRPPGSVRIAVDVDPISFL